MLKILNLFYNKKGSSYVSLMATLAISMAIVIIASNFNVYISQHKNTVNKHNDLSQEVINQIANIYNTPDWETLENEIVNTKYGDMTVVYEFQGVTEFETYKLDVNFELDDKNERYSLERSVYYEQ